MKKAACCLAAALAVSLPAAAQTAAPAAEAKAAPSAASSPAAPPASPAVSGLTFPWARVKDILVRAAEKMPEESYGFQPTPEVRTFGQLVGHVADSNFMICSMALGEKGAARDVEKTLTKKAELVAALKESFAACDKAFARTDAELAAPLTLFGRETNRFAAVGLEIGHAFEHYGNMVTYMRMKGLVPPSSEPRPAPAAPKTDAPKAGAPKPGA